MLLTIADFVHDFRYAIETTITVSLFISFALLGMFVERAAYNKKTPMRAKDNHNPPGYPPPRSRNERRHDK